jgi:DNA polymerase-3 subunit beta
MKFGIERDVLVKGIQTVQNAINTKSTLPILSNILIEAEEESITLIATDLDIGIISKIPVKPNITGSITIPAKKFSDIIKELPAADISISVKKNNAVNIECQNSSFKIMGLPKDEFPQMPEFKDRESITLPQKKLKELLNMTSFAVSHDETRYVLNGILFIIRPTHLRFVATDGRRLALIESKMQLPKTHERKTIVPTKAVDELARILGDEGDVRVAFSENQVSFDMGTKRVISRLIEGEFPNYEQVIPKEVKEKIVVKRQDLLSALRRAALFTNQDSMAVKLEIAKDRLILSKSTPYIGEAREELPAEYKGKDLSVGFNPAYLIDALKNMDLETVGLEIPDPEKPGVIRIGDEYVYVVLPMQLA